MTVLNSTLLSATNKVRTWTLYGEEYDFTHFFKAHPGGELALKMVEGKDCTSFFEQYHLRNDKHLKMLKHLQHMKINNSNNSNNVVTNNIVPKEATITDPFFKELVSEVMKLDNTKMTPIMLNICALFAVFAVLAWSGWIMGSYTACILLPFIQWVLVIHIAHDASHFAISDNAVFNHWCCILASHLYFNSSFWHLQHVVSHHIHTNKVGKDVDLEHLGTVIRFHKGVDWQPSQEYQVPIIFSVNFVWATVALSVVNPIKLLLQDDLIKSYFGSVDSFIQHNFTSIIVEIVSSVLIILFPLYRWGVVEGDFYKAWLFALWPYIIGSFLFMTITQINHINDEAQQETDKIHSHWSHHMVATSLDYCQDSHFIHFITGGLNMQGLHHCVPGLSASRYKEFYPIYRKLCEKHNLKIIEASSFSSALASYWGHITKLADEKY